MITPILLIKATVDGMIARRFGRIVNITSSAVKHPIDILGLSNGARTGLTGFVAGLARKTVGHNVTINNLLPGPFDTDRLRSTIAIQAKTSGRTIEEVVRDRHRADPSGPRRTVRPPRTAAAGRAGVPLLARAAGRVAVRHAWAAQGGVPQPLAGTAAAGGKTALVGTQMAVDRINRSGRLNGRPIELVVADYESKPDVGRRKAEKLLVEDKIDVHEGGFLSNVSLACEPMFDEYKVVNMIGVCLDTTLTTSKCSRYTFRPFDYAPAQAVAFPPYLVQNLGKTWHIAYADYAWGQSTPDAYIQQIKKAGGDFVGSTGIPLGTAAMTPLPSK